MDPPPCQREVAFLLKENGRIERFDVPLDSDGRAFDLGSLGWGQFLNEQLKNSVHDDFDCPCHAVLEIDDDYWEPRTHWDLTFLGIPPNDRSWTAAEAELGGPIRRMVAIYRNAYRCPHYFHDVLSFNKSAPLFSKDNWNYRGDMVLVCFNWNLEHCGRNGQIISPAEMVSNVPAAVKDLWCADFKTFQEMQLAFAMLTHHRLGMQSCGSVLDDNLVHMIIERTVAIRSEDIWELRGLFHAMIQVDELPSDDDEDSLDEEPEGPLIDSADDAASADSADAAEGWI